MPIRVTPPKPISNPRLSRWRLAFGIAIALICWTQVAGGFAKAPPLATTTVAAEGLAAPARDAAVVVVFPAGTEVELTGDATPGFLEVYYDGDVVFVPAAYLTLGIRPGIDTAVTVEETPLLEAPYREADVQLTIAEGQTVILTGATVDGYSAASFEGSGGWIDARALAR